MAEETIDREELLRQLSFIKDPVTRVRKYIEHGLLDVVLEELETLLREDTLYFQNASRTTHTRPFDGKPIDGARTWENADPIIVFKKAAVYVTIDGLKKLFRWSRVQTREFVERCLTKATEIDPRYLRKEIASWAGSWEINATAKALEKFALKRWEGRNKVHRWVITAWWFSDAYLWCYLGDETYQTWLGCRIEETRIYIRDETPVKAFDDLRHDVAVIEAVVRKLKELGATHKEIDNLCTDWMVKYGAGGLDPRWLAATAYYCNVVYKREQEVAELVRTRFQHRTYDMFEYLFMGEGRRPRLQLHMLMRLVNWRDDKELWAIFRSKISDRLSRGQLGLVSYALIEMSPYLENFDLSTCAAEAVQIALASERYGVAAALVNHFGIETCINPSLLEIDLEASDGDEAEARTTAIEARRTELREAAGLARQLSQPIQLQF